MQYLGIHCIRSLSILSEAAQLLSFAMVHTTYIPQDALKMELSWELVTVGGLLVHTLFYKLPCI